MGKHASKEQAEQAAVPPPRPGPGRPYIGKRREVRFPDETHERVQVRARDLEVDTAEMYRHLVELGLWASENVAEVAGGA